MKKGFVFVETIDLRNFKFSKTYDVNESFNLSELTTAYFSSDYNIRKPALDILDNLNINQGATFFRAGFTNNVSGNKVTIIVPDCDEADWVKTHYLKNIPSTEHYYQNPDPNQVSRFIFKKPNGDTC